MSPSPYFSVITPSYQQGAFIGECLRSVAGQMDDGYEHLVLDNCSTDNTASVVEKFPKVRFVREPDRGQSDAVNKGFQLARGEIICWLNSDDSYPSGLFPFLRSIFANPSVQVIFGDVIQRSPDEGGDLRAPARFESRLDLVRWWSPDVKLHQPAIFFRRQARETTGLLREDLHYAMDYEYWWRMSDKFSFVHVPEVLAIQLRQAESKTIKAWPKVYAERERIFSPHYNLVDQGDRAGLLAERRRVLSQRYLVEAYAAVSKSRSAAWSLLKRSFRENPAGILNPAWLGLIRRMLA
ncbi:MAG: glycosyltransferase family 2 protein [Terrimicrobiaceae bacterium]